MSKETLTIKVVASTNVITKLEELFNTANNHNLLALTALEKSWYGGYIKALEEVLEIISEDGAFECK